MIVDCALYHGGVRIKEPSSVAEAAIQAKQEPGFLLLAISEPDASLERINTLTKAPKTNSPK